MQGWLPSDLASRGVDTKYFHIFLFFIASVYKYYYVNPKKKQNSWGYLNISNSVT